MDLNAFREMLTAAAGRRAGGGGEAETLAIGAFVSSRLFLAALTFAVLPVAMRVGIEARLVALALCLAGLLPAFVALELRRSGDLDRAFAFSAATIGALVVAAISAGLPIQIVLPFLVALVVEAAILGSRHAIGTVAAIVVVAVFAGTALRPPSTLLDGSVDAAVTLAAAVVLIVAAGTLRLILNDRRAALADLDRQLGCVTEALDHVITFHDASGAVLGVSSNAERVMGLGASEMIGRGFLELVHVSDRPAVLKAVTDAANDRVSSTLRCRLRRAQAGDQAMPPTFWWAEMHATPAPGGGATCILQDATEQVSAEERLDAAAIIAEQARDARAAFLSTVNHELRTPLNVIIGFSELLSNPVVSNASANQAQEYAAIIHSAGHDLLRIVTAMIDITRLDTGSYDFQPELLDPAVIVDAAIDASVEDENARALRIETRIGPDLPEVYADVRGKPQPMRVSAMPFAPHRYFRG